MKVLITGGTGYLGQRLVRLFDAKGWDIGLIARAADTKAASDRADNHVYFHNDLDGIRKACSQDWELVIHAATNYGREKNNDLKPILEANLEVPLRMLKCLSENGSKALFINVDTSLPRNTNYYSLSKKQLLDWVPMIGKSVRWLNVSLEYFYGPGDADWKFITMLVRKMINNETEIPLSKGNQERDFIYIDDLISSFEIIVENRNSFQKKIENIALGSGKAVSLKELSILIARILGYPLEGLKFGAIPTRKNEVLHSVADTEAIKSLGWENQHTLEEGLKLMIDLESKYKSR